MAIASRAVDSELEIKYEGLKKHLGLLLAEGLIVAFSGGVDSAFLLWAAENERKKSGGTLLALTTISDSFSNAERIDADNFTKLHSIEHVWAESRELQDDRYTANDLSRCFHCKNELFRICRETADKRGFRFIAYGFNASDRGDFRSGHDAARQNSILSPLDEANLTKNDIRELMRFFSLDLADKPASPCLSSRIMTGVSITSDKLKDVEEMETILRDGGVKTFRVRVHEYDAIRFLRIETTADEMPLVTAMHERLVDAANARGYRWVTLDLAGYKTGGGNLKNE